MIIANVAAGIIYSDEILDVDVELGNLFKLIELICSFILLIMLIQLRKAVSVSPNDTCDQSSKKN